MYIELTAAQSKLQGELREYFSQLVTPDEAITMLTERHGPTYRSIVKRMGTDGWLGVGWPVEYGGHGFGEVEQQIFVNEAARADVPLPYVTLQTVGPTLQKYGTAEQKERFLPGILSGDIHFAIGYTEPDAGTDLASLRTSAVRQNDSYVVNGQKIFTTGGHDADFIWLAVRTDSTAAKHRGISMLIVDTQDPGYSWTPIYTCDGAHHVNATYYEDVKVPVSMLVGKENNGWKLITTQLNHERVMLGPAGRIAGLYQRFKEWATSTGVTTERDVQRALGEIHAIWRVNELLNWQVSSSTADAIDIADASATKVFATERVQRVGRIIEETVGRHADPSDAQSFELLQWLDAQTKRNLVITFGGGVNEVMRELIATAGLGQPRVPR
ncbi:MAG: acyl-CoA dehydrogenase family protein [Mycobacteriaceae bacterium]